MQVGGRVQSRWHLICTALKRGFKSSLDVRVRILIHFIPFEHKNPGNIVIPLSGTHQPVIQFTVNPFYSRNGHMGAEFATKNLVHVITF